MLLALALGAAGWVAFRILSRRLRPAGSAALAALFALSLAVGAVRQLPRTVAADAQWWSHNRVMLAPVDRWRTEPRRWRALVIGDCGTVSIVEVEREVHRAILTEREGDASPLFLLGYALGGWRALPSQQRAVPALDADPGPRRPWLAQGWALVSDDRGAYLTWR